MFASISKTVAPLTLAFRVLLQSLPFFLLHVNVGSHRLLHLSSLGSFQLLEIGAPAESQQHRLIGKDSVACAVFVVKAARPP